MAGPVRISREEILGGAMALVRDRGMEALNSRALAKALGCSTQPIFRNFASMEELRQAVLTEAHRIYIESLRAETARGAYPPYKAAGMAYVAFAREQPRLFRLLFMRSRSGPLDGPEVPDWLPHTELAAESTGLQGPQAELFHLEMWAFVHGVAVMLATGYLDLDPETVSRMLTDAFRGIMRRWEEGT